MSVLRSENNISHVENRKLKIVIVNVLSLMVKIIHASVNDFVYETIVENKAFRGKKNRSEWVEELIQRGHQALLEKQQAEKSNDAIVVDAGEMWISPVVPQVKGVCI